MVDYVLGFAMDGVTQDSWIALIKKNKPEWMAGHLNGIGGKIEPGETPLEAMVREFREETGVEIKEWHSVMVFESERHDYKVHVYSTITPEVHKVMTATDEKVLLIPIRTIFRYSPVPNLTWIIPYVIDFYRESKFARVFYTS